MTTHISESRHYSREKSVLEIRFPTNWCRIRMKYEVKRGLIFSMFFRRCCRCHLLILQNLPKPRDRYFSWLHILPAILIQQVTRKQFYLWFYESYVSSILKIVLISITFVYKLGGESVRIYTKIWILLRRQT